MNQALDHEQFLVNIVRWLSRKSNPEPNHGLLSGGAASCSD